jgi:hypothetical protein
MPKFAAKHIALFLSIVFVWTVIPKQFWHHCHSESIIQIENCKSIKANDKCAVCDHSFSVPLVCKSVGIENPKLNIYAVHRFPTVTFYQNTQHSFQNKAPPFTAI